MEIYLAHTQGFCAGVASAIEIVDICIKRFGTPLYVRHEIVHNTAVIEDYRKKGVIFTDELEDIPTGATVVLSAHGVAPSIYSDAKARQLNLIDATCPLVTKVHREAVKFSEKNIPTVLIGHRGHQELIGTSGYVKPELLHIVENESDVESLHIDREGPVGYITQTTLSLWDTQKIVSALTARFPKLMGPSKADICYATQNRQNAVVTLAEHCEIIIICGSPSSSNSKRLLETAKAQNVESTMIENADEFDFSLLRGRSSVGVSSGASVPSFIVEEVVARIEALYPGSKTIRSESLEAEIKFQLPRELKHAEASS
jgi:4-hydroxy-3-methylbut-2-enyl diphosphate reductase